MTVIPVNYDAERLRRRVERWACLQRVLDQLNLPVGHWGQKSWILLYMASRHAAHSRHPSFRDDKKWVPGKTWGRCNCGNQNITLALYWVIGFIPITFSKDQGKEMSTPSITTLAYAPNFTYEERWKWSIHTMFNCEGTDRWWVSVTWNEGCY